MVHITRNRGPHYLRGDAEALSVTLPLGEREREGEREGGNERGKSLTQSFREFTDSVV